MRFDLRRHHPRHAAFDNGAHKFPGALLARHELAIFLEEWLKQIPDFEIPPGTEPELVAGTVNCIAPLESTWHNA